MKKSRSLIAVVCVLILTLVGCGFAVAGETARPVGQCVGERCGAPAIRVVTKAKTYRGPIARWVWRK